jgi:hypothetical protein
LEQSLPLKRVIVYIYFLKLKIWYVLYHRSSSDDDEPSSFELSFNAMMQREAVLKQREAVLKEGSRDAADVG